MQQLDALAGGDTVVPARDGFPLAATWTLPPEPRAVLVIAAAMGVPRGFYRHFTARMAERGHAVLGFDVRGTGGSGPASRKDAVGGFTGFGTLDLAAILDVAAQRATELGGIPLRLVGHSLGSMAFGLAPNSTLVDAAISVASGNGYWGFQPYPQNLMRATLWSVVMPAFAHTIGWFPGSQMGIVGDIPREAALEWSRMCNTPGYVRPTSRHPPNPSFAKWQGPMLVVSVSDDEIMPPRPIDDLHENFAGARITRWHLTPAEVGPERVGHLGMFKKGAEPLWDRMADWFERPRPAGG